MLQKLLLYDLYNERMAAANAFPVWHVIARKSFQKCTERVFKSIPSNIKIKSARTAHPIWRYFRKQERRMDGAALGSTLLGDKRTININTGNLTEGRQGNKSRYPRSVSACMQNWGRDRTENNKWGRVISQHPRLSTSVYGKRFPHKLCMPSSNAGGESLVKITDPFLDTKPELKSLNSTARRYKNRIIN